MARKLMALVVLTAAVGTSLATSAVPGHVRVAYLGSEDWAVSSLKRDTPGEIQGQH